MRRCPGEISFLQYSFSRSLALHIQVVTVLDIGMRNDGFWEEMFKEDRSAGRVVLDLVFTILIAVTMLHMVRHVAVLLLFAFSSDLISDFVCAP